MTNTLKKHFYFDNSPRKRCKYSGEFCEETISFDRFEPKYIDSCEYFSNQNCKRRKLEQLYDEKKVQIEQDIEKNIDQECLNASKRRKITFSTPLPLLETPKTYDEQTVKKMITIALQTQKEKLFELFLQENAEDIQHYEQVLNSLFDRHILQNTSLINSYIG